MNSSVLKQKQKLNPGKFWVPPGRIWGSGLSLDIEGIQEAGAEWVVVEQDRPALGKTSLECAAMSREYLKKLGV